MAKPAFCFPKFLPYRINALLDVLNLCATQFKYREVQSPETKSSTVPSKPDSSLTKARLEEAILQRGAAREMMARHRESRYLLGKALAKQKYIT